MVLSTLCSPSSPNRLSLSNSVILKRESNSINTFPSPVCPSHHDHLPYAPSPSTKVSRYLSTIYIIYNIKVYTDLISWPCIYILVLRHPFFLINALFAFWLFHFRYPSPSLIHLFSNCLLFFQLCASIQSIAILCNKVI